MVSAAAATVNAHAQAEQDFVNAFSGPWTVLDQRYVEAGAKACNLALQPQEAAPGRYQLNREGCGGELALVQTWGISEGQLALFGGDDAAIVRLGGTQRRISGNVSTGTPVVLDRVGPNGVAELLQAALKASGCFYSGFTSACATTEQLAQPPRENASVKVLVNLTVREEARGDAGVLGVIPDESCIKTDLCVNTADGPWCRAEFDGKAGWFRKLALRQNRWPVVTFNNQCG